MNIYNKLCPDIKQNILSNIRKDHIKNQLLPDIKNRRHQYLKNKIYKIAPSIKIYTRSDPSIYSWFNSSNRRKFSIKYINFFRNLLPGITYLDNLIGIYWYYKKIYIGNYENFIDLILDNLTIEDLEDLYDYHKINVSNFIM